MATIIDVAREARVSTATVSRVLNGSYAVTEEKKKRVMDAIEKTGYQIPNRLRKNFLPEDLPASASEKNVLLVICSEFIFPLIHPFQKAADEKGYSVAVTHYDSTSEFPQLLRLLDSLSPVLAGILLVNAADASAEFQEIVEKYPLVQIGEGILNRLPNRIVYNDEIRMGKDAADFLIRKGCRKIGFLTGDPAINAPLFQKQNRLNGYYLSLIEHGISMDPSLVLPVDPSLEGGFEGCEQLLSCHPDLDAVIGITDSVARGALQAIQTLSEKAPAPLVFSLDNNEDQDFSRLPYPYIDFHYEEMGNTALQVLHAAIRGELDRDYKVVIRHSLVGADPPDNKDTPPEGTEASENQ